MTKQSQTMLITGANRGLGLTLAKQMADEYALVLTGRDMAQLDDACRTGGINNYQGYVCDFAAEQRSHLDELCDGLPLEEIDVFVHCASMFGSSFLQTSHDEIYQWSDFLANTQLLIQRYIHARQRAHANSSGETRVILVGSIASVASYQTDYSMYKMYKNALHTLATLINHELRDEPIAATYLQLGSFVPDEGYDEHDDMLSHTAICQTIATMLALPDGCVMSEVRLTNHAEA